MKIVQLYKDYYPPVFGGIEQVVSHLARGAVRAGHEVTVLCSAHGGRRDVDETIEGVRVIRCAEWARVASTPICPGMPARLSGLEADLLHLHFPSPPGEISARIAKRGTPTVVTYHADIVRQAAVLPLYRPVIRALLDDASAILVSSPQYASFSRTLRPYQDKCRIVPLGLDLEPFVDAGRHEAERARLRARYGDRVVLFVGRFRYYKGIDVLLRAFSRVHGRLVLIGGGGEEASLHELAASLGLGDRVVFAGSLDDEGVRAHYRAADVFVLPSVHPAEAFGLASIEAMASGLPVVTTELGTGTSFVVQHERTGLVVPPRDEHALAAAIERLLDDPAERARFGAAGRERAFERFTSERMVGDVLQIYEDVRGASPAASRGLSGVAQVR